MEGSSSDDLVAFLAHSSKKNDEWGVALVMSEVIWESYGSDGEETTTTYTYSEGLDITNSYDELGFNFFISDEHEVDVFEGKCEIFGCGIINDGGVYGKGLVAAAAGRRYQSYKQIVDQFNFMADKDYEWFKDKVYKNP